MKKLLSVFAFVLCCAIPAMGQTARISAKAVQEGSTVFLPTAFYDENRQPVIPERVWYHVSSMNGTIMQSTKVCSNGSTCTDSQFFSPNTDTFATMNLIVVPCANRIETETNSSEQNFVQVWFAYPSTCILAATPGPTPGLTCKYGTGQVIYQKNNVQGLYTGKGSTLCSGLGWAISVGCPTLTVPSGAGNVCDGTE